MPAASDGAAGDGAASYGAGDGAALLSLQFCCLSGDEGCSAGVLLWLTAVSGAWVAAALGPAL